MELPRYVRVNTLRTTTAEAIEHFKELKYRYVDNIEEYEQPPKGKTFWNGEDLNNLLVFPSGTDLHAEPWVAEGKLILQDKASCLSAIVLLEDCEPAEDKNSTSPTRFCNVIDACAAPGNKTTHAAALMNRIGNTHQLYAVDKDDKRILLLKQFTERAGAPVRILHQSFLDIDPKGSDLGTVSCCIRSDC